MPNSIICNQIRCKKCKDLIYSAHRHDFRYCKCGHVAVDGGCEYLRRIGSLDGYEELSLYMPEAAIEACKEAVARAERYGCNAWGITNAVVRTLAEHGLFINKSE
jgi:hypothetical protein